ncbi:unnamed protein product [Adineta ricciae]|uniref:Uncharacterized protein n=1 Tax=Adineta ricciae TaxID=249248 RepID=A0A814JQ60_ADIRI|nr:unnamed protein product [Adineta ricciae]CAF1400442.1 unnamed protein product [Adineta ricciae]
MAHNTELVLGLIDKHTDQGCRYPMLHGALLEIPALCKSDSIETSAFNDENECTQYLQRNSKKRIVLIAVDQSYEGFFQEIIRNYPDVFVRPPSECARISLYMLCCANSGKRKSRVEDDQLHTKIFETEAALLVQLMIDIGDHFSCLGQNQFNKRTCKSVTEAVKYFSQANTFFVRSTDYQRSMAADGRKAIIDKQITKASQLLEKVRNDSINRSIAYADTPIANDTPVIGCTPDDVCDYYTLLSQNNIPASRHEIFPPTYIHSTGSVRAEGTNDNSNDNIYIVGDSFPEEISEHLLTVLRSILITGQIVVQNRQHYLQLPDVPDTPTVVLSLTTDDDKSLLEKLCLRSRPPAIYVLGSQPSTQNEKEIFFRKYFAICYMSTNPEELAVRIAIDMALQNRILGDRHARNKDKRNAGRNYNQCIGILNELNSFAESRAAGRSG